MEKGLILKKQKILLIFKKLLHVLLKNEVSCNSFANMLQLHFSKCNIPSKICHLFDWTFDNALFLCVISIFTLISARGGHLLFYLSVLRGALHFVQLCILIKICFRGVIPSKVRLFTNPSWLSVLIILRILIRTFFRQIH